MDSEQTTEQAPARTNVPAKKRRRLTLEEQIARQEELLAKEKESLAKKQQRLRSLNASKMNKDRNEARKKRNAMLIQLGLYLMGMFETGTPEKNINSMQTLRMTLIQELNNIENTVNDKESKEYKKIINDKKILIEEFENMEQCYRKYGKVKIEI